MKIRNVHALRILDSRGMPTVQTRVELENGAVGVGSAPSGASTGSHEAREKRDEGTAWCGRDVQGAIDAVNQVIRPALTGMDASRQEAIDARLRELDGTKNKDKLGANALIAVSWAAADAAAKGERLPLFRHLGGIRGGKLPCPMLNVINGGCHAGNNLEIQEFMFVPVGAESFSEGMRMGMECYHALKKLLQGNGFSTAVGDEGGFAPDFDGDERALEWMLRAIEEAGWNPGRDVALALDAAAAEWARGDAYCQSKSGRALDRDELIRYYGDLCRRFPLVSIEDPLGEEDFSGFACITRSLGEKTMIVGDDLFTTNPARLHMGAEAGAANAILIKPNQIGTVSETLETIRLAGETGYRVIISHRSGETLSAAISDLAVAVNAPFIKAGAPARGERLAKYNRLLEIEDMLQ